MSKGKYFYKLLVKIIIIIIIIIYLHYTGLLHSHTPKTNHVSREYSVAATL